MPEEKTVMDEVNAALSGTSVEPLESDNEESNISTDDAGSVDGDGSSAGAARPGSEDAAGGEEGEEGEEPAPEETEAEAEARGAERGPDGKFKKKEAKPEGEAEKPAKVEPKKADPVNDPIPANWKKDAQDRIRAVIDTNKTVTAERDQIKQDFDYLIKGVEATGTSPEQYGETLSWLALFNSQDPKNQEKALELVETVAERLATLLGKERSVGDPLGAHPDLKDAVTKGQLTAQYAKEIARTRNGQAFRTEINTNATQAEQQRQNAANELNTARTGLSALEQNLKASDPQYEAKKSILVQALKPVFASIPPGQWVQKFQEAYRSLEIAPPARAAAKTPANQPLRAGKQPAGGQTKAPGSMLEAVSGALAGMGGK